MNSKEPEAIPLERSEAQLDIATILERYKHSQRQRLSSPIDTSLTRRLRRNQQHSVPSPPNFNGLQTLGRSPQPDAVRSNHRGETETQRPSRDSPKNTRCR